MYRDAEELYNALREYLTFEVYLHWTTANSNVKLLLDIWLQHKWKWSEQEYVIYVIFAFNNHTSGKPICFSASGKTQNTKVNNDTKTFSVIPTSEL